MHQRTTAMSTDAVYSQAPLVTERREIRILVLAPGTSNDSLCGELIVESLDYDDLHYTALSYTWSGSIGEDSISICGAPLYITENLSTALRRIRGPTRPRNMWIDAICINQDDHEEKAVQVNMMGNIFASATRTIVWLGEKSADSDMAMDFIGSLRQGTLGQLDDDSKIERTCRRAINGLMQRQWWTRIWVIQEALMSRRVMVQCGEKRVDILNFVRFLGESRVEQDSEHPSPSSESPFNEILSKWHVHKNQVKTSGLSLQALIFSTRGFQASVWRDRIFALLGLVTPEARSYFTPDYSYDVSDRLILIRLTMYCLQARTSQRPLEPLNFALHSRAMDCPSWVIDWTAIWTAINSSLKPLVMPRFEDTPVPRHTLQAAADFPKFEPPFEKLIGYEEPLALLVTGYVMDQVQIAIKIPHLDCLVSADLKTRAESIKTKLREWELRTTEFIEVAWWGTHDRSDDRPRYKSQTIEEMVIIETKAWLIRYLSEGKSPPRTSFMPSFDRLDWYWSLRNRTRYEVYEGRTSFPHGDSETGLKELISDYEAWMQCFPSTEPLQQRSQDICKLCEHRCERGEKGLCAHCVMGQKICRNNAGHTMFVTEGRCPQSVPFAAQEGDIICAFLSSDSLFVMRKAGENYWTLVGTITPSEDEVKSEREYFWNYDERAKATTFRLR